MHYKKGMRINVTSNNKYIENQRDNYINDISNGMYKEAKVFSF